MGETKTKKIIARVLAYIGLIIILLFIIGMIYGLIVKDGKFVILMIALLSIVSLLYRWGIMAYRRVYKDDEKDEGMDIIKNSTINTKKI